MTSVSDATDGPDVEPPLDPKHLLIDWANGQDSWIRRLVAYVLDKRQLLSAEEANDLYTLFLTEKGFTDNSPVPEAKLDYGNDEATLVEPLVLTKLSSVVGVNAITTGYEIEFSRGLTILFGENGAGKTGYARVLKRLAAVRDAEEIIPNINESRIEPPSAVLEYSVGGVGETLIWKNDVGVPPFTRMSVFDSPAVNLHVDDNLAYVYVPADLSLFSYVQAGVKGVQERTTAEARELVSGGNPFVRHFERESPMFATIQTLGPATDIATLVELAKLPAKASDKKAKLEQEVAALKANTLDSLMRAHSDAVRTFETLATLATAVAGFDRTRYNDSVVGLIALREAYRKVREETFRAGELFGEADDEWETFVLAGAQYQEHLGLDDYPHDGDKCLYCRQPLTASALALLSKYTTFMDDALAAQVSGAQRAVSAMSTPLAGQRTDSLSDALLRQQEAGADNALCQSGIKFLSSFVPMQASLSAVSKVASDDAIREAKGLGVDLASALASHRGESELLKTQIADRQTALAKSEGALRDLSGRIELNKHLPAIRTFVEQAKRSDRLLKLAGGLSETLRSLTQISKLASQELINQDFERRFRDECKALRTPKVQLDFIGREGKAQRRKQLTAKHKLSQILSEGEQKVLAIADFLAEARLGNTFAPIIFDDPVNSLDHRRLEEVAARIALLAEERQVVVFTHNIWLATELLARFEKRADECFYFAVTDDEGSGAKGKIDRAGGPRWDTEKELAKRVRELLDAASG